MQRKDESSGDHLEAFTEMPFRIACIDCDRDTVVSEWWSDEGDRCPKCGNSNVVTIEGIF